MRRIPVVLVTLAAAGAAVPAFAASAEDEVPPPPRSVNPVVDKTITAGRPFTFQVRSRGNGKVFLIVSRSKRKASDGTLRSKTYFRTMGRRKGSLWAKKVERYPSLDSHFLNRPGTYYWQAHRIDCRLDLDDCKIEGPVRKFRVKRR